MNDKFFALLCLGLRQGGAPQPESLVLSDDEWLWVYKMARRHGVLGIVFDGVQQLPSKSLPPRPMLMQWIAITEQIRQRNRQLDCQCQDLTKLLATVGIDCCVLKGQGLSRLYHNADMRSPGDIDLWVKLAGKNPSDSIDRSVKEIVKRIKTLQDGTLGKAVYHHVEWNWSRTSVELHYRPQYFNNPLVNRRFQRWCNRQWAYKTEFDGYRTPSAMFNAVYLLAHLYHHLLFEGLSLKQVCDYYMLLTTCSSELASCKQYVAKMIGNLHMKRFAAGVMWVLGTKFHLADDCMIVKANEKEGRFILNELLNQPKHTGYANESTVARFWRLSRYRAHFLRHYPGEILCDIPFRFYNWCWRHS